MRGVCSINRKKLISLLLVLPIALAALLYGGGFIAHFLFFLFYTTPSPRERAKNPLPASAFKKKKHHSLRFRA